jgi:hypothetical protein
MKCLETPYIVKGDKGTLTETSFFLESGPNTAIEEGTNILKIKIKYTLHHTP